MKKIIGGIIGTFVLIIVLGRLIPALWPTFISSDTDVQALTDNSTATTTFQAFWPIILLIVGIGIVVALIMMALKKFNLGGAGGYVTLESLSPFFMVAAMFQVAKATAKKYGIRRSMGGAPPDRE